jgi:hypothetical protein
MHCIPCAHKHLNAVAAGLYNDVEQEVALATGVLLDPVYSGKALHALLSDMRAAPEQWSGKKVLFVHTAGLLVSVDVTLVISTEAITFAVALSCCMLGVL